MKCPKCGKDNKEYSVFCTGCGERLQTSSFSTEEIKEDVDKYSKKSSSKALIIVLVICAVLVISTIAGVAAFFIITHNSGSSAPTATPATEVPTDEPTDMPTYEPADLDMSEIQDVIEDYDAESCVAVSIVDFKHQYSNRTYTINAEEYFVASGFYAPLYNLAHGYFTDDTAEYMMEKMDNKSANELIDALGGLETVNSRLSYEGAHHTTFERYFGDTAASKAGYENYTTAADVATVMETLHDNGGYTKMKVDLDEENVYMPSGISYYAHRGGGIGDAYNVYVFIENSDVDYFISVLTQDIEVSSAKDMISEIIFETQYQMENIYE